MMPSPPVLHFCVIGVRYAPIGVATLTVLISTFMIHLEARKSLGQNFLIDPAVHARIVASLGLGPEDQVIEIGPGTGLLTKHLLAGALQQLTAFELDDRAVPLLREEFAGEGDRFRVVEQDILTVDLAAMQQAAGRALRVIGNIPYYITSPILFRLIDERAALQDATLLVQWEVAERLTASPRTKAYGIPTVLANFFAETTFLFKVKAGAFRPVPRVDSAVVRLDFSRDHFHRTGTEPPAAYDASAFRTMVRGLFAMRRKTIRNNIKALYGPELYAQAESSPAIQPYLGRRAEELTVADFLELHLLIRSL